MKMKPMVYKDKQSAEILYEGNVKGYDFRIISQGTHPCAYVRIPISHPYFKLHYDKMEIYCHGGLTFSDNFIYGDKGGQKSEMWWIGWDYAHWGDYVGYSQNRLTTDKKWTTEQIYNSILVVIAQLIEVADK